MKQTKFHVNPETGAVGECTASIQSCKYNVSGDGENHYSTESGANKAGQKILMNKYGTFGKSSLNKKKNSQPITSNVNAVNANTVTNQVQDSIEKAIDKLDRKELKNIVDQSYTNYQIAEKVLQNRVNKSIFTKKRLEDLDPSNIKNHNKGTGMLPSNYESCLRDYEIERKLNAELKSTLLTSKYCDPSKII